MSRILVIDDDEAVRGALTLILETHGHEVVSAGDGKQGLAAANDHIDLVICDIFMPQMDGIETIRMLRERRPDLPLIAISGSMTSDRHPSAPDYLAMAEKFGVVYRLQKPFRPAELLATVRQALGERSA